MRRVLARTRPGVLATLLVALAAALALALAGCGGPTTTAPAAPRPGVALPSAAAPGATPPSALPSEQEIAGLFDQWNQALATLDPQRVADRYAPDAVLLPTVSNQVRTDRAEIVDYFAHFLLNKPRGQILDSHIKILDPTEAIDTGTYRFTLTTNGQQSTVDARYTFVYEKIGTEWLIINHHSSAMPETETPPARH